MTEQQRVDLADLYRLSRVALDSPSRYERMVWAAREFVKSNPEHTEVRVYKILDELMR